MKKTKAQHRHAKQAKKRERQAREHSREKFGCAEEVDPMSLGSMYENGIFFLDSPYVHKVQASRRQASSWEIPEDHWEYEEGIYSKDDRLLVAITVCMCIVAWVLCAFMGSR